MWLTIASITLLAAIGFSVLAVALQWFEFARKVDGGSENGCQKISRLDPSGCGACPIKSKSW
jgi:hypothetical protein